MVKVQSVNYIQRFGIRENVLAYRLAYSLRHSARAIFVTSFTTFCAFMATVPSPIMSISAFGLWGAWMVIADFFLAITGTFINILKPMILFFNLNGLFQVKETWQFRNYDLSKCLVHKI